MDVEIRLLKKTMEMLSIKSGHSLDHAGLKKISLMIFGPGEGRYLYHNIHHRIKSGDDGDSIGLQEFHLNEIAKFLGYNSFNEFKQQIEIPADPVLTALHGSYYCYVRASHQEGYILRSPVNISSKDGRTWLQLQGKSYVFEGEVVLRQGCLFILMESAEGKSFYHVYRIGTRKSPEVLQGVFAGVSTAFDPIGGRTVLVRQQECFESLSNAKMRISDLYDSDVKNDKILAAYFREYPGNNLSTKKAVGFSWEDLTET